MEHMESVRDGLPLIPLSIIYSDLGEPGQCFIYPVHKGRRTKNKLVSKSLESEKLHLILIYKALIFDIQGTENNSNSPL